MSQQFQQPTQQPTQMSQQPTTQQMGQQPGQMSQQPGQMGQQMQGGMQQSIQGQPGQREFEDAMPSELRVVLHDITQVALTAQWCADRCIDEGPQMADCARLCQDLADVAHLNERLIVRDSAIGPYAAEFFMQVAEQCLTDLQQYQQPHVQETCSAVQRAIDSTRKELNAIGWQTQQSQQPMQQY